MHGYIDGITLLRQYSRGSVKVQSSDPFEHPLIDPNSLSHPQDLPDMVKIRVTFLISNLTEGSDVSKC